jgi:hypothetical protein
LWFLVVERFWAHGAWRALDNPESVAFDAVNPFRRSARKVLPLEVNPFWLMERVNCACRCRQLHFERLSVWKDENSPVFVEHVPLSVD